MMRLGFSLPDLCETGVTGDEFTWNSSLNRLRREMAGKRRPLSEAGHLGVLLMLAGQPGRARDVFVILDELARLTAAAPGRGTLDAGRKTRPTDQPADSPAFEFGDENTRMNLLAALVLSGRWTLARRCCERMVRPDHAGTAGTQRSHLPFSS
jgi:hypothetical protein